MSDHNLPTQPAALDDAQTGMSAPPLLRPFYPKVLVCFIISLLCLAWMVSLQLQSERHASMSSPNPTAQSPAPAPSPLKANAPAVPVRQLSENDFAIAEIDAMQALAQEENPANLRKIIDAMRPYTFQTNAAVRDAATHEFAKMLELHDKVALKSITDATAQAKQLADNKDFAGAIDLLQTTLKGLPDDATVSGGAGPDKKLNEMIADFEKKRVAEREAALGGLEDALRKKNPDARARLDVALRHPDGSVRREAALMEQRVAEENDKALGEKRSLERTARQEWVRFFRRFGGTVAEGDFTGAAELIEQPPFEAITKGGVSDPDKVFKQLSSEIQAVQNLYDEALKDAKGARKQVSFHLRKGGQAAGTLVGVNGKLLRIMPSKGAEIGVKITDLPAEGIRAILDSGLKRKPSVALALADLEAFEAPDEAESIVTAAYERAHEPMPLHWVERFRLEKLLSKVQTAEEKLAALKKAVASEDSDDIKAALNAAKPVIAELNELGSLSAENRALLQQAEKISAKKEMNTVTLQNGKSPDGTYRGINTDQISDYRDSLRRTDVGVGYGLKLGASGGLQRVLIKFDGLETAVGNGRVRKATLMLYQIDSPQFAGAGIGIFRIKRPWQPDSGSWMSYDGQKDHDWAIGGASGDADIEAKEDTKVLLDKKANQWRLWDVTKYVQDVLGGKAQNYGLLLKIVNGEPDFHVRFYPETDLDRAKDTNLRPKLVLDVARDAE